MKAYEKPILRFFEGADKIFKIPVYQRNYEWTVKQCRKLIEDIEFAYTHKMEYYFVGSIVYVSNGKNHNGSDECLIIDGQQRLTTISLILIAIRELITDETMKQKIAETYLINKWAEKDKERIKLKPSKEDYKAFEKILNNKKNELISESPITNNFQYIKNKLNELDPEKLKQFYDYMDKLFVVDISLEKEKDDPQLIFESINSTGLALQQSDLIRNFVLMKQKNQEELYENYWVKIEKNTHYNVSRFIKDYLTLKNRIISNEKNVYEDFKRFVNKNKYKDINKIESLLEELTKFSRYYHQIISNDFENKEIKQSLKHINELKMTVLYPFILEIIDGFYEKIFNENTLKNILKYLETIIIRRTICDIPANALNKLFMNLGKEIEKHTPDNNNYYEIFKYIINHKQSRQRLPKDTEFKEKLLTKDIFNFKAKKYFLIQFENHKRRERVSVENVSVEHIMPQTLTNNWKEEIGDNYENIHEKYLNTIGNLTLLQSNDNSEIRNIDFLKKKKFFNEKSNYYLNEYFKNDNLKKWNKDEIEKRAKNLIEEALQIWEYQNSSFNIPSKESNNFFNFEDIDDYNQWQGEKPCYYKFLNDRKEIEDWSWLLLSICKELYQYDKSLLISLVENQAIKGKKRKYLSSQKNDLHTPLEIDKSVFIEGNFSTADILSLIDQLFSKYEIENNCLEITLKSK